MVGPTIPIEITNGPLVTPNAACSWLKMDWQMGGLPWPPAASGHDGAAQPSSCSVRCHARARST